jgi:HK97 family phage major capsid protein
LLGRIPNLRRVPFNITISSQTGGGVSGWVGQKPKPVTSATYASVSLGFATASGIIAVTEELVNLSQPGAERALRDEMADGTAQFLDQQFVDPAVAEVVNVSPGSITNGTTAITSAGTSAANASTDLQALITQFVAANPDVDNMVLLMKPANAVAIARAENVSTLGLTGGSIYGIPVVTSGSVGDRRIALDAQATLFADDGAMNIDVSRNASIHMETAPADPNTSADVFIPLWATRACRSAH